MYPSGTEGGRAVHECCGQLWQGSWGLGVAVMVKIEANQYEVNTQGLVSVLRKLRKRENGLLILPLFLHCICLFLLQMFSFTWNC